MKIKDKRINTLIKLFITCILVLAIATVGYEELPILVRYSLFSQDSFYAGFITNMYNSVLDFLVFSIILLIFLGRHEKDDKILLYQNNIDDCRFWYSEEAAFRNAGNIRRLKELDVKEFDLSKSTLVNTKLKNTEFNKSKFMGASLVNTNFDGSIFYECDFKGATATNASFNNVKFNNCNFKYTDFSESKFKACDFKNCDFSKSKLIRANLFASVFIDCIFTEADFDNCNLERTDLRKSNTILLTQILKSKDIIHARFDYDHQNKINAINPDLLKKRSVSTE